MKYLLPIVIATLIGCSSVPDNAPVPNTGHRGWVPLFNGTDLTHFYTFRPADGKNKDASNVFKVEEGGVLHVMDLPVTENNEEHGYVSTNDEYRNYHLRLEYKWGEKKFRPRENAPRDSGLLFHMLGEDVVWPQGLELQIQEHDTGDVWILPVAPRPTVTVTVANTTSEPHQFNPGGKPVQVSRDRVIRSVELDSLTDWNVVDLYVTGNQAVYAVNGKVNNVLTNIQLNGAPFEAGRIALQAEGAELFYRNVQIRPVFAIADMPDYKVLLFSKTAAFRHDSIPAGIEAIQKLGAANGFTVDATEDAALFTEENLKQYKAVIFLSTTGNVLDDAQQAAFEKYIKAGGGFVGIHAAADTEYDWAWYGQLVGAYFRNHPRGTPVATIKCEHTNHASTMSLPTTWTRSDEWYNYRANPRANVTVLLSMDETSYQGGSMNGDHPIAWCHDFDGGRAFYTGLGHTKASFAEPLFLFHLLGGIQYAAGTVGEPPKNPTSVFATP